MWVLRLDRLQATDINPSSILLLISFLTLSYEYHGVNEAFRIFHSILNVWSVARKSKGIREGRKMISIQFQKLLYKGNTVENGFSYALADTQCPVEGLWANYRLQRYRGALGGLTHKGWFES